MVKLFIFMFLAGFCKAVLNILEDEVAQCHAASCAGRP